MATRLRATETPSTAPSRGSGGLLGRLSLGHLAVALAALLAFVANVAFLRAQDDMVGVVALSRAVSAGSTVTAADLSMVEVAADGMVIQGLFRDSEGVVGQVATRNLAVGSLVGQNDVLAHLAPPGMKTMAIPVSPAHAAGGLLRVGDMIDIVDVGAEGATHVVRGASVLAVPASDTRLGSAGPDHVVIGVMDDDVLAIAQAIADGEVDIVIAGASGG